MPSYPAVAPDLFLAWLTGRVLGGSHSVAHGLHAAETLARSNRLFLLLMSGQASVRCPRGIWSHQRQGLWRAGLAYLMTLQFRSPYTLLGKRMSLYRN